ncbi:MAG: OmpA family protein [Boseongicola sp.]
MPLNKTFNSLFGLFVLAAFLSVFAPGSLQAAVFTVSSVPNARTMILADGSGNTITVSSTETNTACFRISAAGRVTMFAGTSLGSCDRTIPLTFTTNGFDLGRVDFADIDDMDGFSSRDAFAAGVAGTWTSSDLGVYPLIGPGAPAWADQRGRLAAAGGVGSFLARPSGNDPVNDAASFLLSTPTTSFTIYMDDVEGLRNAQMFFDLAPLSVEIPATLTLNKTVINDGGGTETASAWTLTATGPSTLSGVSGTSGDVLPGTYTLSESGPSGYTMSDLSCTGAADTDPSDGLTLADSETVSCTFTNDDDTLVIDALDDTPTAQNGLTGGTTPESVLGNDTLNGVAVVPAEVTLTPATAPSPTAGSITMNPDGTITVAAGTTAGSYSYDYSICEVLNPTNCDTATATVTVDVSPLAEIEAELSTILNEDMAQTISNQSRRFSGLANDALDRLMDSRGSQCESALRAILEDNDVNFATASTVILPQSEPLLDEIFVTLSSCPNSRFEIAGHTDSRGSDDYNLSLSQGRVDSVKAALVRRGVISNRLVGIGYGERRPIADNSTAEGQARNRRVEFVALDSFEASNSQSQQCGTVRPFDVNGSLSFGETGLGSVGTFGGESFDCGTSERRITHGEFTLTDSDDLGTQGMLSFSFAREKQIGFDRLNGRFWGGYLSRTSVDGDPSGSIDGVGINAGIYSARAHNSGLFSNYYAAGSLGLHSFDLDFGPSITGDGNYAYAGLFAGAGLSGEIERGELVIRPRVGFDMGIGVANDADVTASGLGVTQSGSIEIDPVYGIRGYLEATFQSTIGEEADDQRAPRTIAVTPRIFCDSEFGSSDTECGLGGEFEYSLYDPNRAVDWELSLGAEATSSVRSLNIGVARERVVLNGLGKVSTQISGNANGGAALSHFLNLEW